MFNAISLYNIHLSIFMQTPIPSSSDKICTIWDAFIVL